MQPLDGLSEKVKLVLDEIDRWWDVEGFGYIREMSIQRYGQIALDLSFTIHEHNFRMYDNPVTKKREEIDHLQYLRDKGFVLVDDEGSYSLADCESNRAIVKDMILQRFPSARFYKWESHCASKPGDQDYIWSLKVFIPNMLDVSDKGSEVSE
jgi:hypothetical protein